MEFMIILTTSHKPINSAASLASTTLTGDLTPLFGVKNAGKSLLGPKVATVTPCVSWIGKKYTHNKLLMAIRVKYCLIPNNMH